jgi:hypothetical protein
MDKDQICAELDRVRRDFRELLDTANVAELRKPTNSTKWNNEQLLFHMLFGYLLVSGASRASPRAYRGGSPRS